MSTFKDKNQKTWRIELNVGTARRVLKECNIDLINVVKLEGDKKVQISALEQLSSDPILLVDTLFVLCRDQLDGLDDFAFASLFDASAINDAANALLEEIINFSQPALQGLLTRAYQEAKIFVEQKQTELDAVVNSQEFKRELNVQFGKLFSNTPELSESTPVRLPSGN